MYFIDKAWCDEAWFISCLESVYSRPMFHGKGVLKMGKHAFV